MRGRMMGVVSTLDKNSGLKYQQGTTKDHGPVAEEIPGLIRLYKDGHVERLLAVPDVPSSWSPEPNVTSHDTLINPSTGVWARIHLPRRQAGQQLPLLVYFHGGGFCVGSPAWSCYHEFLARLAARAGCVVLSVGYRLAPEHRLPAAYDDGVAAVKWARQQAGDVGGWRGCCNPSQVFVGGDSAGAAVAHHVAARVESLRGVILIQPFFGGEARIASERNGPQASRSILSLATSDSYWRLALPPGAGRDHPWCNPLANGAPRLEELRLKAALVFVSEMDILRDRNLELCDALRRAGKSVERVVVGGVGHAFQILDESRIAQARTTEMLALIKAFVSHNR